MLPRTAGFKGQQPKPPRQKTDWFRECSPTITEKLFRLAAEIIDFYTIGELQKLRF